MCAIDKADRQDIYNLFHALAVCILATDHMATINTRGCHAKLHNSA